MKNLKHFDRFNTEKPALIKESNEISDQIKSLVFAMIIGILGLAIKYGLSAQIAYLLRLPFRHLTICFCQTK